jgi:transcription-repair coupling factor (superfamily II helicase)
MPRIGINQQHKHSRSFKVVPLPDITANIRAKAPAEALSKFLEARQTPVLFVAESPGRREIFSEFLGRAGITTEGVDDWQAFVADRPPLGLLVADLARGLDATDFALITETDLYGRRVLEQRASQVKRNDSDQIVRNLNELHIGAPVVHIDHGVGRYLGLTTLTIDAVDNEFLALEYADEATLYVPVASLHLISRYGGSDKATAPLHRLGSDQWDKARRKAAKKAFDVAAELLNLYALRASREAAAFTLPEEDYAHFSDQFAFAVTHDQQMTIDAVLSDMCSAQAMDRLVCGDVGFGKTEVAMRAAFVAVQNNKQVAVLVPTTLLAQQHGATFRDRFADWPVRIEVVSRLRADSEVKASLAAVQRGNVDILIGTHRLLSPELKFADLGLVIVDE